jgi:hypothetical protein
MRAATRSAAIICLAASAVASCHSLGRSDAQARECDGPGLNRAWMRQSVAADPGLETQRRGRLVVSWADAAGRWSSAPLTPGRYRMRLRGIALLTLRPEVSVRAGFVDTVYAGMRRDCLTLTHVQPDDGRGPRSDR